MRGAGGSDRIHVHMLQCPGAQPHCTGQPGGASLLMASPRARSTASTTPRRRVAPAPLSRHHPARAGCPGNACTLRCPALRTCACGPLATVTVPQRLKQLQLQPTACPACLHIHSTRHCRWPRPPGTLVHARRFRNTPPPPTPPHPGTHQHQSQDQFASMPLPVCMALPSPPA